MSTSDPKSEQFPVVTQLEGFPDPVRDPDTGMIMPQTRRERRALEAAQEKMLARKAARKKQEPRPAPPAQDRAEHEVTEDLDFGSDPASDIDPEESTVLTVTQVDDQDVITPAPKSAQEI